MAAQNNFAFVNGTVVSEATAVSILSLLQDAGFEPTGACVSLNVVFDADTYWGSAATVDDSDGALVVANTPVSDAADGRAGNAIPIASMFVFKNGVGNADCVIYARFIA